LTSPRAARKHPDLQLPPSGARRSPSSSRRSAATTIAVPWYYGTTSGPASTPAPTWSAKPLGDRQDKETSPRSRRNLSARRLIDKVKEATEDPDYLLDVQTSRSGSAAWLLPAAAGSVQDRLVSAGDDPRRSPTPTDHGAHNSRLTGRRRLPGHDGSSARVGNRRHGPPGRRSLTRRSPHEAVLGAGKYGLTQLATSTSSGNRCDLSPHAAIVGGSGSRPRARLVAR